MVRKTEGGQASSLINAETLRFNAWASDATGWAGALDEAALPAPKFVDQPAAAGRDADSPGG